MYPIHLLVCLNLFKPLLDKRFKKENALHYLFNLLSILWCWYEPPHDKTNKMTYAPSEDSDQPGHPPIVIRVFAVRMKKVWVLSCPLSAQRRLIRLGGCPGWSEYSLGAQSLCWFCHEAARILFNTSHWPLVSRICLSVALLGILK